MDIKFLLAKGLKRLLNPPALRDCSIDATSRVCSKSELNSVHMGRYSYIGNNCFMVNVDIGAFCSIADGVCIGGARHPIERVSSSPVFHEGPNIMGINFQLFPIEKTPITKIKNDVWVGLGAIIKAGVTINNGAVIGAGSVITHDVPAYEIWAGNPAKCIKKRFSDEIIMQFSKLEWWDWEDEKIAEFAKYFDQPKDFLNQCRLQGELN